MENEKQNKLKYGVVSFIVIVFICMGCFMICKEYYETDKIQELSFFDINVYSCLNLMPGPGKESHNEAYFVFTLNGIDPNSFLNEYEIEHILLNNQQIDNEKIIYEDGGFRFYSSHYKHENNVINLTIKEKATNVRYSKKLKVSTETAM